MSTINSLLKPKVVLTVAAVVALAVVVILVGGGRSSRLVGTWELEERLSEQCFLRGRVEYVATLEFFSNGIVIFALENYPTRQTVGQTQGIWQSEGGRLVMSEGLLLFAGGQPLGFGGAWDYTISGRTLTLDGRGSRAFTRR